LQQPGSQGGPPSPSQAPTTGTFCIQEMTATFCNVPVGPNTNGYGSGSGTASTGGSASSGGSAASAGARVNASSLPPCMREPAANELCY
jgi:hypothetical protein